MNKLKKLKNAYDSLPIPKTKEVGDMMIKVSDMGTLCISAGRTSRGEPAFVILSEDECILLFKYMQHELGIT